MSNIMEGGGLPHSLRRIRLDLILRYSTGGEAGRSCPSRRGLQSDSQQHPAEEQLGHSVN